MNWLISKTVISDRGTTFKIFPSREWHASHEVRKCIVYTLFLGCINDLFSYDMFRWSNRFHFCTLIVPVYYISLLSWASIWVTHFTILVKPLNCERLLQLLFVWYTGLSKWTTRVGSLLPKSTWSHLHNFTSIDVTSITGFDRYRFIGCCHFT